MLHMVRVADEALLGFRWATAGLQIHYDRQGGRRSHDPRDALYEALWPAGRRSAW